MHAKFYLSILGMLIASSLFAQAPEFPEGSQVIASPTMLPDRWERCTVDRYTPAYDRYELSCRTAKYIVPARYVLEPTEQNAILLVPPAAQDLMAPGTEVLASPTYLPDRWERCLVVKPIYETNGYEINCNSVFYIVSRTQVLPATAETLQRHLTDGTKNQKVIDEQGSAENTNPLAPKAVSDTEDAATETPNGNMAAASGSYYAGMMIEASPINGAWGDAIVIEQVDDGFRVQMLPGIGYVGAPQLVLQTEQMRKPTASTAPSLTTQPSTTSATATRDLSTEQQLPEPLTRTAPNTVLAGQALPNQIYSCGKSTGGMVFFMGDIELRDGFYRGPAYDGKFGDWYLMEITLAGTVNWGGPLPGFESDISRVASTQIKSDGGRPAFDVLLEMASGSFMSISCVPK